MTDTTHRQAPGEHDTGHDGGEHGARAATSTAREEARGLAATGRQEAARVTGEAKAQAAGLVSEVRHRTRERTDSRVKDFAAMLDDFSGDLDRMANEARPESPISTLARDGATAARSMSHRIEDDGLDGVMRDVRRFARQRPVVFLTGAFAIGMLAGRLMRNADVEAIVDEARTHEARTHEARSDDHGATDRGNARTSAHSGLDDGPSGSAPATPATTAAGQGTPRPDFTGGVQ